MNKTLLLMIPAFILLIPGLWITQGWTGDENPEVGLPILFVTLGLETIAFILGIIGTSQRPKSNKEPIRNAIRNLFKKLNLRDD
jgi:hypothetical protein